MSRGKKKQKISLGRYRCLQHTSVGRLEAVEEALTTERQRENESRSLKVAKAV